MVNRVLAYAALLLGVSSCATPEAGSAVSSQPITVEWIYSPDCGAVAATPEYVWRADSKLLLLDPRDPPATRAFVLLDPKTRERRSCVDAGAALRSLASLMEGGGTPVPSALRWPQSFSASGDRAIYLIGDDLFVLELSTAAFRRVTETPQVERAASFSPNGERVAFVRDNDLFVYDLADGRELRLTSDGSATILNGTLSWVYWEEIFGRRDIGYWWAPDSTALAFLRTDESRVAVAHFPHFLPAVPEVRTQRYPKTGSTNPEAHVGIVEIDGRQTTFVELDGAGFEYVARVQWHPDSARVAVQTLTRDQRRLDLFLAARATGATQHVLTETDPAWVNIHDDLHFLRDGRQLLWVSERDGYSHLYLHAIDGGPVRQITRGKWSLRSSGGGVFWLRQAVAAVDEPGGWIYFTALEKSSIERHLYRIRFDGSGMERVSAEDGTHAVAFSPDARHYVDTYSDIRTLPALRLHDAGGEQAAVLSPPRPKLLAPFAMRYPSLNTIPARDGFEMPAQILKPPGFDPSRRYPAILHIYAGPSAPSVSNAWQHANYFDQVLGDHGYVVVKVDNRSATALSKATENTVDGQLCGDSELNDLVDAARWLKQQRYIDPDRVGVWGWSGGGSTTLLLMTRSEEFCAGIAVAPVTDWHYYDTKWAEAAMKRPQDNPEGYEHTSLVKRAKDLHGRLLLVHGTYDDNVHPQNSWHFIHELVAANKPFDMMMYPMRKHGIADQAARIHLFTKMVEFWTQHL